jgi:hypothetical protein
MLQLPHWLMMAGTLLVSPAVLVFWRAEGRWVRLFHLQKSRPILPGNRCRSLPSLPDSKTANNA